MPVPAHEAFPLGSNFLRLQYSYQFGFFDGKKANHHFSLRRVEFFIEQFSEVFDIFLHVVLIHGTSSPKK
jgi:hypothetical protein